MTQYSHVFNRLGTALGMEALQATVKCYAPELKALTSQHRPRAADVAYATAHERQKLDIYSNNDATAKPVILFVHGGGFALGSKEGSGNIGAMALQLGLVGVVMNYRLVPDYQWPSGADDITAAIHWLQHHIRNYGGDPENIILAGTSAGAVHCAGYLQQQADTLAIKAAVLLSGFYGFTPLEAMDTAYYGTGDGVQARLPLNAVIDCPLPLFIASAEFDPPRMQQEFSQLQQARLAKHGQLPIALNLVGHNHYSLSIHLGTSDTLLRDHIGAFIRNVTA